MLFLFLFSVLSVSIVKTQKDPTIIGITPDQIKDIGSTVELSCSVLHNYDYAVMWTKLRNEGSQDPRDFNIISANTLLVIRDARLSLRYDSANTSYTLQIKNIQDSDAGLYKCQISTSQKSLNSKETRLQIHRPPFFYDDFSSIVVFSENHTANLECNAGGVPKPQISWRRENNATLPTGGSVYEGNILKIDSIRKEDRGIYYCIANNGVDEDIQRIFLVQVEFAPVVHVIKPVVFQALKYDAELECRIEAYPTPVISWSKDGIKIEGISDRYKVSNFVPVNQFIDTTLRVRKAAKDQFGTYVCEAVNKLGSSSARIDFNTSDSPVCPPACGSTSTTSRPI